MTSKPTLVLLLMLTVLYAGSSHGSETGRDRVTDNAELGSTRPLAPDYVVRSDGSVRLRICYNWSCSSQDYVTFSAEDMDSVRGFLEVCPADSLANRLQRLRIGVWQMELLAQKYQPLLRNDRAINDFDFGIPGRTDCVDNTSNTTTYLAILKAMGELSGWTLESPEVRNFFDITMVHWAAVARDTVSGGAWTIDSWYRPNGNLPYVLSVSDWREEALGWKPPYRRLNPNPQFTNQLCPVEQASAN